MVSVVGSLQKYLSLVISLLFIFEYIYVNIFVHSSFVCFEYTCFLNEVHIFFKMYLCVIGFVIPGFRVTILQKNMVS